MKKHLPLAIVALLLCASLCAAQTGRKSKAANKGMLEAALIAKEKELWEAWKNKNAAPFEKLIPADGVLVSDSGVTTRDVIIKGIVNSPCEIKDYTLSDFKVTMIDKDAAILTLKAEQNFTCNGTPGPTPIYASSVFVKRNGQWLNIFHQETTAKQN